MMNINNFNAEYLVNMYNRNNLICKNERCILKYKYAYKRRCYYKFTK